MDIDFSFVFLVSIIQVASEQIKNPDFFQGCLEE